MESAQLRGRARLRHAARAMRRVLRNRWDVLAMIAAGGALGSLARWGIAQAVPVRPGAFPWATFTANVTGSLALGALMVLALDVWPPSRYLRPFLGTGVLGGYTTFSTYMLDTRNLLVGGRAGLAGAYLFGSLASGLLAVWLGVVLTRTVVALARGLVQRRRDRRPVAAARAPAPRVAPRAMEGAGTEDSR